MRNQQNKTGVETINEEFNLRPVMVVDDPLIIAMLTAAGLTCRLTLNTDGSAHGEFTSNLEFEDALARFHAHILTIDARECWEAFRELEWRVVEKDVEQANTWPKKAESR